MMPGATEFDPTPAIQTLQVVFKIAERCNINCTYCYYFNMGDTTPLDRPAQASEGTAQELGSWIAHGCRDLGIPRVMIAFHGGEPMLLPPARLSAICDALVEKIGSAATISFGIQTNGTILTDEWLSTFRQHGIRVGVSMDGDQVANDRFRLTRRGGSTFAQTEANLKRLVEWAAGDPRLLPATLSVLDPRNDYRRVYRYLRSLGVEQLGFLLPDRAHDQGPAGLHAPTRVFGDLLFDVFHAWLTEDNPNVRVRFIDEFLAGLEAGDGQARGPSRYQVVIARSDGTIAVDDSLTPALAWYQRAPTSSIRDQSLRDFLGQPAIREVNRISATLPTACSSCEWRTICRGGDVENRYSMETGFDNPSVYCDAYQVFYARASALLGDNGYPVAV